MPAVVSPAFSTQTLKFLRALKRNNTRDWFRDHRADYDAHVHDAMVAVVDRLAEDFARVAPDFIASPKVSMFRPWRDTRFSANKAPLKTNVAAVFPHRALGRMQGAALYFEVSPEHVMIGGGMYAPDSPTLHAVRSHIAGHHRALTAILAKPTFKRVLGAMHGETTSRVPRGFDPEHPAADLLRHKQFLAAREEVSDFAARPDFYKLLLATFEAIVPFVMFLNAPLVAPQMKVNRDPLAAEMSAKSRGRRP